MEATTNEIVVTVNSAEGHVETSPDTLRELASFELSLVGGGAVAVSFL